MKTIIIILVGTAIITMAENCFDVKFGHWYDRVVFETVCGLYGMIVGLHIWRDIDSI